MTGSFFCPPRGQWQSYEISQELRGWKADGTFYRRVITRDGEDVIEKGVDGRYVPDYRRPR